MKGGKFSKLKSVKADYFKMKIFSFNTLEYWENAYSFRSMKLVEVFCRKNASKMSKIELLNWYFH